MKMLVARVRSAADKSNLNQSARAAPQVPVNIMFTYSRYVGQTCDSANSIDVQD